jgi:hypothetical protein
MNRIRIGMLVVLAFLSLEIMGQEKSVQISVVPLAKVGYGFLQRKTTINNGHSSESGQFILLGTGLQVGITYKKFYTGFAYSLQRIDLKKKYGFDQTGNGALLKFHLIHFIGGILVSKTETMEIKPVVGIGAQLVDFGFKNFLTLTGGLQINRKINKRINLFIFPSLNWSKFKAMETLGAGPEKNSTVSLTFDLGCLFKIR